MRKSVACALALCAAAAIPAAAQAGWEPSQDLTSGHDAEAGGASIGPTGDGTAVYSWSYRDLIGGVWQAEQPLLFGGNGSSFVYAATPGGRQLSIGALVFATRPGVGTAWQQVSAPDLTGLQHPNWSADVAPNGDLALAAQAQRTSTSHWEVDASVRPSGAPAWTPLTLVTTDLPRTGDVRVATDGAGAVDVVWEVDRGATIDLRAARVELPGGAVTTPQTIATYADTSKTRPSRAVVSSAGGAGVIAWTAGKHAYVSLRPSGSGTFGTPVMVSGTDKVGHGDVQDGPAVGLAADGGLTVVYRVFRLRTFTVDAVQRLAGQTAFGAPVRLSTDAVPGTSRDAAIREIQVVAEPGNRAAVAWWEDPELGGTTATAHVIIRGASGWGPDTDFGAAIYPKVAASPDGKALLAWAAPNGGFFDTIVKAARFLP